MGVRLEYLPVSCVGKLAFEREHLRVNLNYPAARALDHWIQQGRQAAMLDETGAGTEAREAAEVRFLINEEGGGDLLAGILRPSEDLEGRPYPFALFTAIPRSLYGKHYALLPLGLEPVWDGIEDLSKTLATLVTRHAFLEVISDATVPGPLALAEARQRYDAGKTDSVRRLFERTDGSSLSALEGSWGEVMAKLKKGPARGAGAPRIVFPVSRSLPQAAFDLAFWLDLLNRQFLLKRFEPSAFLDTTPTHAEHEVVLVFGKLAAADYAGLTGLAPGPTELLRPARGREPQAEGPPADLSFAELLGRRFPTTVT